MSPAPKRVEEKSEYLSYLLRLWRVNDNQEPTWRASLKSSRTGQQVGFGNLEALFDCLRRQTRLASDLDKVDKI